MSVPRSILEATESMANEKCDLSDINPDPAIRMTPYGEQDENGVDVSLIRANLRLTPLQRIRQADRTRRQILSLRKHARRIQPG